MKVRALKSFEGIRDLERSKIEGKDVFPKEGDVWEVSEERAIFLKEHNVVEIVVEVHEEDIIPLDKEKMEDLGKEIGEHIIKSNFKNKKTKSSKK